MSAVLSSALAKRDLLSDAVRSRVTHRSALPSRPVVHVVDDDAAMRDALSELLASADIECRTYASTLELLSTSFENGPSCLVLDLRLPGESGLELQARLQSLGRRMPIIFVTGFGDIESCARAMKRGAFEFLTKPFDRGRMIETITTALAADEKRLVQEASVASVISLAATLTRRESEVMRLVVLGLSNKHVAMQLGITEGTVKLHRGNVMQKMNAQSLAGLVRMATSLPIIHNDGSRPDSEHQAWEPSN